MNEKKYPEVGGKSEKRALILLVIVYVFNFVDRQILSVLAEDIKAVSYTHLTLPTNREV